MEGEVIPLEDSIAVFNDKAATASVALNDLDVVDHNNNLCVTHDTASLKDNNSEVPDMATFTSTPTTDMTTSCIVVNRLARNVKPTAASPLEGRYGLQITDVNYS